MHYISKQQSSRQGQTILNIIMSGSGLGTINSTPNQSNSTKLVLLVNGVTYTRLSLVIPACIQLLLCAIALVAIARVRVLRSGQNIYIVNMIISDVLRAIVGLWLFIEALYEYDYGDKTALPACQTLLFLWYWQFFWSMWGTVLISQSRHSTISNPLAAGVTTRKAVVTSAITCLMGFVVAVPPLFTWAKYVIQYVLLHDGHFVAFCTLDLSNTANYLSFVLAHFGVSYWLPLAIVIYYLVKTLRLVIQNAVERRRLNALSSSGAEAEQSTSSIYKSKALWYVISIVGSNTIFPAPFIIVMLVRSFRPVDPGAYTAAGFIFTLNFVVNSVLYCFWVRTLTRSLRDVFCCRKLRDVSVRN